MVLNTGTTKVKLLLQRTCSDQINPCLFLGGRVQCRARLGRAHSGAIACGAGRRYTHLARRAVVGSAVVGSAVVGSAVVGSAVIPKKKGQALTANTNMVQCPG